MNATEASNQLLHEFIRSRDPYVFSDLMNQCYKHAYLSSYSVARNGHDAEDAVHKCFQSLFGNPEQVNRSVIRWVAKSSANIAKSIVRTRERRTKREEVYCTEQFEKQDLEELLQKVESIVANLNDRERKIIKAVFYNGQSQAHIAKAMGQNQSTVSREIDRIVKRIRAEIHH